MLQSDALRLSGNFLLVLLRMYMLHPLRDSGEGFSRLLPCKGQAVRALIHGRIALMRANLDLVQRAIILHITMMGALLYGAFNGLIGRNVHISFPPFLSCRNSMIDFLMFYKRKKPEARQHRPLPVFIIVLLRYSARLPARFQWLF